MDYVETLKRKRDELDAQFRQQRARRERDGSVPPQPSPNMESTLVGSPGDSNQTPSTAPTSFSERSVQAAMGEIGFLSRNAMAEPRDESRGFPQELATGSMVKAALVISGEDPSQSQDLCHHRRTFVTMMGPATGISKEFAAPYMNRFLDHIGVMFLHIDRGKLQGEFDSCFEARRGQSSATKGLNSRTAFLEFRVYMAVAIGMLLSPEPGSELLATAANTFKLPVYNSTSKTIAEFDFGCHIIMHARLMSSVRSSSSRGRLYHYRNLSYWRDLPKSVKDFASGHSALSVSIKQLTCRALTQIALLTRGTQSSGGIVGDTRAVEHDVVDGCQAYINDAYYYSEQGKFVASFIHGFDLFAAGVLVICLPSLSALAGPPRETAIISKCTALLTTIGERFQSLKVLRKLLLALSSVAAQGAYHDPYSAIEYTANMAPGITEPSSSTGPSTAGSKPTVYVLDTFPPKAIEYAKTLFDLVQPQDEEFKNWRQNARALLVRSSYVTADDIASCPNLIAIGKHGVGIDKINQDACAQRGIKILNTPGANARDVAELVVTLALSVARGIRSITSRQMLKPVPKETCNGLALYQKTIGIIGMGNIGRTVAEIFRGGFDANIVAYDAYMPEDVWSHIPHTRAKSVDEVLAQADVLSIHVPLTTETRDMISYQQIRAMKPDAILINAARGGIVNEADLTKALSEGYLWGAGLDCHEQEPPSHEKYEALWKNLNVISTPHIGAATSRAQLACATAAVDNLYQYLSRILSTTWRCYNPGLGDTVRIHDKHRTEAGMADEYIPLFVHGKSVRSRTSEGLKEETDFGGRPIGMERKSPDGIGPSHGHVQKPLIGREGQAIRGNSVGDQAVKLARGREPIDTAGLVGHSRLALIGKVDVVGGGDDQVVRAFEPLEVAPICNHDTAILSHHKPVRLAIPANALRYLLFRVHFENSTIRDVYYVETPIGNISFQDPHIMGLIADAKRAMQDAPKEVFNAYVLMCTCFFALSGVSKGFDEGEQRSLAKCGSFALAVILIHESITGNIASVVTQAHFKARFGVDTQSEDEYANTKGWLVSIATAGAVFGCLGCSPINDRFGRRWTLRIATVIYIAGVLGQGLCGGNLSGLYASRFIAGLGIGPLSIVPPVYITEISPKAIRGLLTVLFAACQQLGVVLGFFINYGVTKQYPGVDEQWMLPTLLQIVPAVVWGLGTFLCSESPRWLLYKGQREQAAETMSKLRHLPRDHSVILSELAGMDAQILHETEAVSNATVWDLLKETFVPVENRRRFFLIFMATLFSQWSGANAITQYSPQIFGYLGIDGDEAKFLATGIYGVVKFVSTVCFALFIVDFIGRRRSLITGICLQLITLIFVGAYLGVTSHLSTDEIGATPSASRTSTAAIVAIFLHAVAWSIGRSLEELDSLFQRPWYTVYQVAYPSHDEMQGERVEDKLSADGTSKHIEQA
ncbi:hypothetical protein APSETT445_006876 [Aspergillus pseudonomiae]